MGHVETISPDLSACQQFAFEIGMTSGNREHTALFPLDIDEVNDFSRYRLVWWLSCYGKDIEN